MFQEILLVLPNLESENHLYTLSQIPTDTLILTWNSGTGFPSFGRVSNFGGNMVPPITYIEPDEFFYDPETDKENIPPEDSNIPENPWDEDR